MIERKLFELPIYSMSEEDLQNANELLSHEHRYNQIVGYVVIFITSRDVGFFKFGYLKKDSRHIQHLERPGSLMHVEENHKNKDIKDMINSRLIAFRKEISDEGHVLDTSAFDNAIKYMNIRRAIDDLQ